MAKIRAGNPVLLRGEVTRVDNEDDTITVMLDDIVPIRHTLRADSSSIGGPIGNRLSVFFGCRVLPIYHRRTLSTSRHA